MKAIVGIEYLFKVEKTFDHGVKFDDSFKICDNRGIIEMFKSNSKVQTPKKVVFCSSILFTCYFDVD